MRKPTRRETLAEKFARIENGEADVTFGPWEFVLYVLLRQDETEHDLIDSLGYKDPQYIGQHLNNPISRISKPASEKLAYLSDTKPEFWQRETYTPKDAEDIRLDLEKNAEHIGTPPHPPAGSRRDWRKRVDRVHDKSPSGRTPS